MAPPKIKTATEKELILATVAKLDLRGWTQFGIRDGLKAELGFEVSQVMVSNYLKQIRERYKERQIEDRAAKVNRKVAELYEVRREAWLAYDRSMADSSKMVEEFADTTEQVGFDDFVTSEKRIKRIVTTEGRLPDNAYLTTILNTLKQERELLGLDPEKPVAQNNINVVVAGAEFWSGLVKQMAASMPTVEARVTQAIEFEVKDDATS